MSGLRASPGSLAAAVADADEKATVLDDRQDIEDAAAFRWLRAHQVHRNRVHHLALGTQPLPAAWRARAMSFRSESSAQTLLRELGHDVFAMHVLRDLARGLSVAATSDADMQHGLALALVSGRMWAIQVQRPRSRFVGKTSPAAFAPINPRYGTKVDFAYIAKLEGDQWLRGYVPISRQGVVIGRSGMTIASGFDIGQWSERQFDSFGFPQALSDKLKPFCNHSFKGLHKNEVAAVVAKLGPVPEIDKAQADLCDGVVFGTILGDSLGAWDRGRSRGVPAFTALPGGWQTVWLSRFYQEGPRTRVPEGTKFRQAALAGRWADAVSDLRGYSQYRDRATAEANLLAAAMPPPLAAPPSAVPRPPGAPAAR
jgi:hypothetical protein